MQLHHVAVMHVGGSMGDFLFQICPSLWATGNLLDGLSFVDSIAVSIFVDMCRTMSLPHKNHKVGVKLHLSNWFRHWDIGQDSQLRKRQKHSPVPTRIDYQKRLCSCDRWYLALLWDVFLCYIWSDDGGFSRWSWNHDIRAVVFLCGNSQQICPRPGPYCVWPHNCNFYKTDYITCYLWLLSPLLRIHVDVMMCSKCGDFCALLSRNQLLLK